ncbi:MAG TPA: phosphopantetheine-binding protein [Puia sp.]|nr:phosphopantetheine-binding protein [Puia sp.]
MERTEILEELKSMMGKYMHDEDKVKLADITDDTDFVKDLNMDSIDLVDIVIQAENKYGIEIKNETISKLNTIGACLDVIQQRLAEKGQQSGVQHF